MKRRPQESEKAYFERLTVAVADGMTHCWTTGGSWKPSDMRYTEVSLWDNYLFWLRGFLPSYAFLHDYEFLTPAQAITPATAHSQECLFRRMDEDQHVVLRLHTAS